MAPGSNGDGAHTYRPRHPERTAFYQLFERDGEAYRQCYEERFEPKDGPLRREARAAFRVSGAPAFGAGDVRSPCETQQADREVSQARHDAGSVRLGGGGRVPETAWGPAIIECPLTGDLACADQCPLDDGAAEGGGRPAAAARSSRAMGTREAPGRRLVGIFSAGCPACSDAVDLVRRLACDVRVLDMSDSATASCARALGIRSVPASMIDGSLAECCAGRGPNEADLRAAGLGQPSS